jgi:hypothetical protein
VVIDAFDVWGADPQSRQKADRSLTTWQAPGANVLA